MTSKLSRFSIHPRVLLILFLSAIIASQSCRRFGNQLPDEVKKFGEQYQTIRNKGTFAMEDMLSLFHWEHTTMQLREAVTRTLYFEMNTAIKSITFRPWVPEHDAISFFPENTFPNLKPQWVMMIHFDEQPRHTLNLPLGYDGKAWKIINPIQKAP